MPIPLRHDTNVEEGDCVEVWLRCEEAMVHFRVASRHKKSAYKSESNQQGGAKIWAWELRALSSQLGAKRVYPRKTRHFLA